MDKTTKKKNLALEFILLFGLISALGDITYEGARSIYGSYLGVLGANAVAVGLITGFGEFLGYAIRAVSGYFIDKTGNSWIVTTIGYAMLISVPLLALAEHWEIAALFIILERIGKAVRSPGKDTMISHATKHIGSGFGFGISEALGQIGAIIGPLIFTVCLSSFGGYKQGVQIMWAPAILTIAVVLYTKHKYPNPSQFETITVSGGAANQKPQASKRKVSADYWLYSLFIFFSVLGFAGFPILSYHFLFQRILNQAAIPTLYAVAMAIDGLLAVFIGKLYDRMGIKVLVSISLLSIAVSVLGFSTSTAFAVISILLWGCVMSIHETVMKAAISDITPVADRGKAFGYFNTIYGMAMLIGNSAMGFIYERSVLYVILYAVIIEVLSIAVFIAFINNLKREQRKRS